jgi:protein-S-isoprenylcysteine O-methyltransferase Ste14
MPVAALVVYAVWFALTFGLRTVIQWRHTGSSGFKALGGRPGSLEWIAGVLFTVALVVGVAGPVADLAGLEPLTDAAWLAWLGLAVAVFGVGLTLAAQISMGDSWRIGVDETERTDMVTDGAFAIVRNPIFSAMLVTAVGLTAMVPNVVSVVGLVALVVALELQVRVVEEPYLATVHGESYEQYRRRVGRFVPRFDRN